MSVLKINWGVRVTLLYLGFVALIGTLVYKSMHTDFDLVSKDYYNDELKYQEVIDAGKNQANLSQPVQIQQLGGSVVFTFPAEFSGAGFPGRVQFYSEVNEKLDRIYPVDIIDGKCTIPVNELAATNYIVKLHWTHDGKPYYQQTALNIK